MTVNLVLKLSYTGDTTGEAYTEAIPVVVPAKTGNSSDGGSGSSGGTAASALVPQTPSVTVTGNNKSGSSNINVSASLSATTGTNGNAVSTEVKINTDVAEITFDKTVVNAINSGTGDVSISVAKIDTAARRQCGDIHTLYFKAGRISERYRDLLYRRRRHAPGSQSIFI